MERVKFNVVLPEADVAIPTNVSHALSLGLLRADDERLETLTVVANGPSASGVEVGGWTLALNGAIGLFPEDSPPSMWAALDSQALVADFIERPDQRTTFYVASRCHPDVLAKLEGHDVRLWHLGDEGGEERGVPPALSVTLSALMLMRRLGWRKFDIHGWDACLSPSGAHHAHGSSIGDAPLWEVELAGRTFVTTTSWLNEAEVAGTVLMALEWSGAQFRIHGDGMIAHAWRQVQAGKDAQITILRQVEIIPAAQAA